MNGSASDSATALAIRMFGPFEVTREGAPLPRLRSRKGYWLLALLALRHGREIERRWLAGTLWPDSTERQALDNLRESLKDLRRALGPQAARLRAPAPHTLCLDLSAAECDLIGFDTAITRGDTASLEGAVAKHRAPLLEDWSEEWIHQERRAREQAYLSALETLAAQAVARGAHATAIRHLHLVVAAEPLRESAQRTLMQALAATGDYAAATQTYRDLRLLLHRELNTEPVPETAALYQRIRAEAQCLAGARGTDGERAGGRGAGGAANSGAQEGRQGAADGTDRPPQHSVAPSARTFRIPHPLTRLIGREREVQKVQDLLITERLVTLTGAGGVGKTRVALQVAEEVLGEYGNGVWFVELASLADPALVPRAIASVLEVQEQPGCPLPETLCEFLCLKQTLLILDNCEHLAEACAQIAETLLRHCRHLRILATSRHTLGLSGETLWRVPSLTLPDADAPVFGCPGAQDRRPSPVTSSNFAHSGHRNTRTPEHLALEYDAVRLFVERARAAYPAFKLTPENTPATVEVCRRLDGIPLAIELAAARVKALPVEFLNERLGEMFRVLTGGSRTGLPRHRTLQATLDWSYSLLTEPERMLLRRLAVFAGGWTLDAAEAICGDFGFEILDFGLEAGGQSNLGAANEPDANRPPVIQNPKSKIENAEVLDLLTGLVEKSLVQYEDHGMEARYRLLETVRQYGWDRLQETGEAATTRDRHRDWFLEVAEAGAENLPGEGTWLLWLDREHDNVRAALGWSEIRGPVETALRYGAVLGLYWQLRGRNSEGRQRLEILLALPGAQARTAVRARNLLWSGLLTLKQGYAVDAQPLYEESLAICREVADQEGMARALFNLAMAAAARGEYDKAVAFHGESQAISRTIGSQRTYAWSLQTLASMHCARGEYVIARALLEEAKATFQEIQYQRGIAYALLELGATFLGQEEYDAALQVHRELLPLLREMGDIRGIAFSLRGQGMIAYRQRAYADAERLLNESLAIFREFGLRVDIARQLNLLGMIAHGQGKYDRASLRARESLIMFRDLGQIPGVADCLETLGKVALAQVGPERAARLLGAAEALRESMRASLAPAERWEEEGASAAVCRAMDHQSFARAWAEGRAMSLLDAIAYALE